ncbi:MAG: hypothetical protein WCI60_01650 [bacterium]
MSSLQAYLQNALAVDNQETSESMNYEATKAQLDAMGKEIQEQAISQLPFAVAEVSRAVSGIYQHVKKGQELFERKGGINDLMESIGKEGGEPFDIGKLAGKLAAVGGEKVAEKFAPLAEKYGLDLKAIQKASTGEGGIQGAINETKSQLKAIADKNIERLSGEINRGVDKVTGAVTVKASELEAAVKDFTGKGLDELKSIQGKIGETLQQYSPAELSKLSEGSQAHFKQLTDLVKEGEVTPEGLAKLKTGAEVFTKRVGLEKELTRVTGAKEQLSEQAGKARAAIEEKVTNLTEQHTAKLSAAEERISKLQAQKEQSESIVKESVGRLQERENETSKIFELKPVEEFSSAAKSNLNAYRTGGSLNVSQQVKQARGATDEELIAKHQAISEKLGNEIGEVQKGKQQMVEEFQGALERETAPMKQTLSELTPAIQQASEEVSNFTERLSQVSEVAGHGLAALGVGTTVASLAQHQVETPEQITGASLQLVAGTKVLGGTVKTGIQKIGEKIGQATGKTLEKPVAETAIKTGEETAEKTGEEAAIKTGEEAAIKTGAEAGTEIAAEAGVAAGASVVPIVGEAIDIGLGIAMGVQSLVDIFGGSHNAQPPPPPPSQAVAYQHQQGVY